MKFLEKIKERTHQVSKRILASEEVQNKRIEICNSCDQLINSTRQCKKCGCFVDAKTKLAKSACPVGKWEAVLFKHDN